MYVCTEIFGHGMYGGCMFVRESLYRHNLKEDVYLYGIDRKISSSYHNKNVEKV